MTKMKSTPAKKETFDLTTLSQENVPTMLETVHAKLKELKGDAPDKRGTTKPLPGFNKKIEDFTTVEELIMAYSSVKNREKAYNEVAEELGVNTSKYPFKLEGYAAERWLEDIRFQLAKVKNKKDIERLEEVEKTLSKYLSEKDKMKKDLEKMAKLLNDDEV